MGKGASAPFESPRSAQAVALKLILLCEGDIGGLIAKRLPFLRSRKSERFLPPPLEG